MTAHPAMPNAMKTVDPEVAVERFLAGFNCAQAVLSSCAKGMSRKQAYRLASAFGAGMGRTAGTCGAVTGALLVLGLRHGHSRPDDLDTKEKLYGRARTLMERFQAKHGSTVCKELLGCDISTPDGLAFAREQDMMHTRCQLFVRTAVEILNDLAQGHDLLTTSPLTERGATR